LKTPVTKVAFPMLCFESIFHSTGGLRRQEARLVMLERKLSWMASVIRDVSGIAGAAEQ